LSRLSENKENYRHLISSYVTQVHGRIGPKLDQGTL